MPVSLTQQELDAYRADGFHFPVTVFDAAEALSYRHLLEDLEQAHGQKAQTFKTDLHLLKHWAYDLVTDPRILDPVEDVLGPDILCWSLNWFIKEASDGKFVTPHQDSNYWGLYPHDVTTAWLALSDAGVETGPMKFLPGSHLGPDYDHEDTFHESNLLSRGQRVVADLEPGAAVTASLKAGEMSLHHVKLVHYSEPNHTADRRIGMVIRYAATNVQQTKLRDTAVLVRGVDRFGHFDLLGRPETEMGQVELARHRDAVDRLGRAIHSKDYE